MEQGIFLPFSSLVASMLLFKNRITSTEIINFISLLSQENIFIDDNVLNFANKKRIRKNVLINIFRGIH